MNASASHSVAVSAVEFLNPYENFDFSGNSCRRYISNFGQSFKLPALVEGKLKQDSNNFGILNGP